MKFYYLKYEHNKFYGLRFRRFAPYCYTKEQKLAELCGTPIFMQNPEKLIETKKRWEDRGIKFTLESIEV
jgi:hypothetical protein